jgi:hypothetical protein
VQPPKRQIIKTRPQRPYIIARIVLFIIVLVALGFVVLLTAKPHGHALTEQAWQVALQEAPRTERTAPVQASMGHPAHADLR